MRSGSLEPASDAILSVSFVCSEPRAREGYYRFDGGIEACIARGLAFAPYADLIWMETKKPILSDAHHFSVEVRKKFPSQLFAYNLSPSFNWNEAGMTDPAIKALNTELGKLGYVWQFITYAENTYTACTHACMKKDLHTIRLAFTHVLFCFAWSS